MDGMSSTRAIRQLEDLYDIPRCQIIALTGLASASARLEALSSGVDQFITKPLNFRLLSSLLEKNDQKRKQSDDMRDAKEAGQENKSEETTANGSQVAKQAGSNQGDCNVELESIFNEPGLDQDRTAARG
jgi:DNA-binding response OmpR family regulator